MNASIFIVQQHINTLGINSPPALSHFRTSACMSHHRAAAAAAAAD
jgi:hypothetical protein